LSQPPSLRPFLQYITSILCLGIGSTGLAADYNSGAFYLTIPDSIPASEKLRGVISTSSWSPPVQDPPGRNQFQVFLVENRLAELTNGLAADGSYTPPLSQYRSENAAMLKALDAIATQANRPELKYVPLIFQGCSIHGSHAMLQAAVNPDRTLGAIAFCGRNYALYDLIPPNTPFMPELSIPLLMVSFGDDTDRVVWNDSAVRDVRMNARGLWSASLHPGLGHCESTSDGLNFELLWLKELMRRRLPTTIPSGAFSLKALPDTEAWLGDYTVDTSGDSGGVWGSGYRFTNARVLAASTVPPGDIGKYLWFPSRTVAEEWKHYSNTGTCCTGITYPDDPDSPDAGTPPEPDAGHQNRPDASADEPDAGALEPDASTPEPDASTPEPDASTPEPDASTPEPDASTPGPDASTSEPDASTQEPDAGFVPMPDSGSATTSDSGSAEPIPDGSDHDSTAASLGCSASPAHASPLISGAVFLSLALLYRRRRFGVR
jgi:uncharacterized protein (TIGR03382 family)